MHNDAPVARVVAFDVDHTITTRDCVLPFMWRVASPMAFVAGVLRQAVPAVRGFVARDRDALKAVATMAAFGGRPLATVEAAATTFAGDIVARHLRDDVVAELRTHLADGDAVLLVSASFEVYIRPLGDHLGVVDSLATRLDVGADGRLTGAIAGANCRGAEKVARLHAWLDAHHGGRASVHLTVYGDSAGDREMLQDADVARWAGRGSPPDWFPTP